MLVILFMISLTIVSAFSKDDGLKWLNQNIDWTNANLKEASLAFLALKTNNYNVDKGLTILVQRQDNNNCYPRGNCNTIETAFAALALSSTNQDVSKLLDWLESSLTKAQTTGWYIQINTQKDGSCTINYEEGSANVIVNTTYKIQPYNVDWVSVENNLKANLDKPIEQINVNCNKINDPSMIISLIRIVNNEFTIVQQESGNNINLVINNACYPRFIGGSCDEESSFYISWALAKLNKEIKTIPYLEDSANTNQEYAILYLINKNEKYAQKLTETQSIQGHWDNNILATSFAIDSLKRNTKYYDNFNNATKWLESKQITSGTNKDSFGTLLDSAAALYLVFTEQFIPPPSDGTAPICGNNILEFGEECESNLDCSTSQTCNSFTCACEEVNVTAPAQICLPSSLRSGTDCSVCNSGGTAYVDNDLRCRINEVCQNGICVPSTEAGEEPSEESPPQEPEEDKGLGAIFWISLIIIILILGVGGYLAYKKFFKKEKPSEPEFLPRIKQPPKTLPPRRTAKKPGYEESLEHELDKSIREAERLLKK